jgi:hypothetical protein
MWSRTFSTVTKPMPLCVSQRRGGIFADEVRS